MRIMTVMGARPQFVKAAAVSRALASAGLSEVLVHTGQHFDPDMSDTFFDELGLPEPAYNLGVHGLNHGAMTGRMMEAIEGVMVEFRPDVMLVYGDTNSTLAGALVAAKLGVSVAHVEAGLRSYNLAMPEEINRALTDRISTFLFAPTPLAVQCLEREGIVDGVHMVGDVMMDAVVHHRDRAIRLSTVLADHGLRVGEFYLATLHRPSNVDEPDRLREILDALMGLDAEVAIPLHPRTRAQIVACDLGERLATTRFRVLPPASYLDMLALEHGCRAVITDSGGVQKEAYIQRRPCFTLRAETEWHETVDAGWNRLVEPENLGSAVRNFVQPAEWPPLYGDGQAAQRIVAVLAGLAPPCDHPAQGLAG
ncbi:MAG: UDP-N-acetylglucosamine 2-epimerase (non-hydrolyzing) [Acidimicrobiales bacterium]